MSALVVVKFPSADGAENALVTLRRLEAEGAYSLLDGALVSWPSGKRRPITFPVVEPGKPGTLDQAFWGMLLALLFFVPKEAASLSAASDALHGALTDFGIDADFVNRSRERITEGCSALFVLRDVNDPERVAHEAEGKHFEIVATTLSDEDESRLRHLYGHD